jgi:hypothetical protein
VTHNENRTLLTRQCFGFVQLAAKANEPADIPKTEAPDLDTEDSPQ